MALSRRAAALAHCPEGLMRLDYDALGTVSISTIVSSAPDGLQYIIRSAPPVRIPSPPPTSRDYCLLAVFPLRDQCLASTCVPAAQESHALGKLASMTRTEGLELGNADPERLTSLIRSAVHHEPALSPALSDDADCSVASMTAMVRKLCATEGALNQIRIQRRDTDVHGPASPSRLD